MINSTGTTDKRKQVFFKIRFLDYMALDIAAFGEQQGLEKLIERVDLKCGAIPPGEYEQIIDQSAPEPFLDLYMKIAEKRFAFAVTALIKANEGYITPLTNYCFELGKANKPEKLKTVEAAYELINAFVLDGMPDVDTKEITVVEANRLEWKKLVETHQEIWNKVQGDVAVYYQLQSAFIEGLLFESGISFLNEGNSVFTVIKD